MQDRTKNLFLEIAGTIEADDGRRNKAPAWRQGFKIVPAKENAALRGHIGNPAIEPRFGVIVDHRSYVSGRIARIAERQFTRGTGNDLDHAVGDILLHA